MNATIARAQFIAWLRANFPNVYREAARESLAPQLGGFLDTVSGAFEKFTDAVPKLAETYVTTKAQLDAIKLNIARAKAGQPPIDPITGGIIVTQQPMTPVDTAIAREGMSNNTLLLIGGALLLFLFMKR